MIARAMDDEKQRERCYPDNPRQRLLARIAESATTKSAERALRPLDT
jgi:hypothetical protein